MENESNFHAFEEKKRIFADQLNKRLKQKRFWNSKRDTPDYDKLYIALFPDKVDLMSKKTSQNTDLTRRVRNWINGQNFPDKLSDMFNLCRVLKCDMEYFFTENAEMPNKDIACICKEYDISPKSSENLLAIAKDKTAAEMLNTVLNDYESLVEFLKYLYVIKTNQHLDTWAKLVETNSKVIIEPLDENAPKGSGFSIGDAIKRHSLDQIIKIIDKWTK